MAVSAAAPNAAAARAPDGFPEALESTAQRFLREYRTYLRTFEEQYEIARGVVVTRTGGHTPGHSVVRLKSGGDRLTFAGDAVFQIGFDHPDLHNGVEHDPHGGGPRARPSVAGDGGDGEMLLATHLSFLSVCHVKLDGDTFRCVPVTWDY